MAGRRMDVSPGEIWWAEMSPQVGREQAGRRPVVIVSSPGHMALATELAIVVPVTSTDRHWPNHVALSVAQGHGAGFAMTEQVRTISRQRLVRPAGVVTPQCLAEIREWVADFLDL